MDPFSQALLGAAIGQAVAGRQLGRRAALWGAVAGAAPDLDMLFSFDFFTQLRLHRGVTHSLWFGPVVGGLWAGLMVGWARRRGRWEPWRPWLLVLVLGLLSHPLLDVFTPYGTQLLAPFSDARFAWHAVPVIEPRYTLILLVGLTAGWVVPRRAPQLALLGVVASCLYLGWGWWLNQRAIGAAEAQLAAVGVIAEVYAFPTFMQLNQRRVVAFTEDTVRVGRVDATAPVCITWDLAPRSPDPWLERLRETREGGIFSWFTGGVETWQVLDTPLGTQVELFDLRYGLDADARRGLWGVRALFARDGALLAKPEHFYAPLNWSLPLLWDWLVGPPLDQCGEGLAELALKLRAPSTDR